MGGELWFKKIIAAALTAAAQDQWGPWGLRELQESQGRWALLARKGYLAPQVLRALWGRWALPVRKGFRGRRVFPVL